MEYVEGETLRDRVRKGSLEPGEAVGLVDQVAAGLGEAHAKDILHRDVKSANIMVTAKGTAKVLDFGLAKLRGDGSLTKSQTTIGTIAYMSPEQARGERLDRRTDIPPLEHPCLRLRDHASRGALLRAIRSTLRHTEWTLGSLSGW